MVLARYRDQFWFPNGALAVNITARVFPLESSGLASLFTDVTGSTPLANPLSTNSTGFLEFWAEEGEYWIHIDSQAFRVSVGAPENLDTVEASSVALSSGLISGGALTPAGTSVSIAETVGYVVDYATDTFRPTLTRIHLNAQTVPLTAASLARTITWWLVQADGTIIQQGGTPTTVQRRTHLVLGASVFEAGAVVFTEDLPVILPQPANQLADLMDALGPFTRAGNDFSANGTNLMIDFAGGTMFSRAFNYTADKNDPHTAATVAQTPADFRRLTQDPGSIPAQVNTIDPANYDVGGTITPVGGGSNQSTIQRVFLSATGSTTNQLNIQYGQATYSSLSAAVDAIGQEPFVKNPILVAEVLGWIVVTRTATDLSDPAQARLIRAGKFATP